MNRALPWLLLRWLRFQSDSAKQLSKIDPRSQEISAAESFLYWWLNGSGAVPLSVPPETRNAHESFRALYSGAFNAGNINVFYNERTLERKTFYLQTFSLKEKEILLYCSKNN